MDWIVGQVIMVVIALAFAFFVIGMPIIYHFQETKRSKLIWKV